MSGRELSLSRIEKASDRSSYLVRMLRVLELVAIHDGPPLTVAGLADTLEMPMSTAFRLVSMLVAQGFVQRDDDGHVSPGPGLVRMALRAAARSAPDRRLQEVVETLGAKTGESVSAGALVGDQIVLVARREPSHELRVVVRVGDITVPHKTAMGKAVLAHLGRVRQLDLLRRAVGPEEAEAVLERLEPELADVRRYGFATDEEDYALGQRCRAAAVLDERGTPRAAISISGPTSRYTEERARASVALLLDSVATFSDVREAVA